MILLRMMLRLFTTIFGTTHPRKEDEDKYAWMLFAMVVMFLGMLTAAAWLAVRFVR